MYAALSTVVPSDIVTKCGMNVTLHVGLLLFFFFSYSHIEHCDGVTSTYRILMVLGSNIGCLSPASQLVFSLPDKCRDNTLN